jgi:peptide/nickel transport system permease protein
MTDFASTTEKDRARLLPVLRRSLGNTSFTIGFTLVSIVVLAAILADFIAPHDPNFANPVIRYTPPLTDGYLLGTDELGRDILSRLIYGARMALVVAIFPTIIALCIGGLLGLIAGYAGSIWDTVVMRYFDIMFAFPGILLALGISAAIGPGLNSMIIAMVVVTIPEFGRIIRGVVLGVREELFVEAAHVLGYSHTRILLRHVLPNVLGPALIYGTLQTGRNVILAASLSFLGLGTQPPTPDWGQMLSGGRTALATAGHVATIPGLAIVFLAVGFNLLGDGIRDLLDPRARRGGN